MRDLPRTHDGAFVVRKAENAKSFAILTVMYGGKEHHFEIEDSAEGLHLKKASIMQPNLSALIAFYKHTQQKDLPHPLATW